MYQRPRRDRRIGERCLLMLQRKSCRLLGSAVYTLHTRRSKGCASAPSVPWGVEYRARSFGRFPFFEPRENALLGNRPLAALAGSALYVPIAARRNIEDGGALGLGQAKAFTLGDELIGECDGLWRLFCNHASDATCPVFFVQADSANCKKRFPRTLARTLLGDFRRLSAIGKTRIPRIAGTGFACEPLKLFAISAK